jgi:hypothetical protein
MRIREFVIAVSLVGGMRLPAHAGTITIKTETRAVLQAGTLVVRMNVLNSGDEPARLVVAAARVGGREERGDVRPELPPGTTMDVVLRLPWAQGKGQWPLVTTTDYADGRGYPFQAMHVALVSSSDASPALVAIVDLAIDPVVTSGEAILRIKNLSVVWREARLSFSVPVGLEVENPVRPLMLEPWADAEVRARVVNRSGLAGSRYVAFAAVEYDDEEGHHTALARGMVEVRGADPARGRLLLIGAAALIMAWFVILAWRQRKTRRPGSTSPPAPVG